MKKIFFIVLLIFSSIAHADWTFITESSNDTKFYLDFSTVQKKNNLVRVWQRVELPKPQIFSGENYLSMRAYREYDCTEKRERILSLSFFSQNNLNGNIIHNHSQTGEWGYVAPNTSGSELMRAVCGTK